MKTMWRIWIGLGVLLAGAQAVRAGWGEDFEAYPPGTGVIGQNGWRGWDGDPALDGVVIQGMAQDGEQSLVIFGATDLVQPFHGYTSGVRLLALSVFVPWGMTGRPYILLMDQYVEHGPKHWTVQCALDPAMGWIIDEYTGAVLPLRFNEWTNFAVLIDLDHDTKKIYYGDQLLSSDSWTCLGCAGQDAGVLNVAALNLYAGGGSGLIVDRPVLANQFTARPAPRDNPKGPPRTAPSNADFAVDAGGASPVFFPFGDGKKCYYTITVVNNFGCDDCQYAVGDWATRGDCEGDDDCPAAGTKEFGWSTCKEILDVGFCTYEMKSQGKCR